MTSSNKDTRLDGVGPVTEADIERARTVKGGWTAAQFREWGVTWPPPKGWKQQLIKQSQGAEK